MRYETCGTQGYGVADGFSIAKSKFLAEVYAVSIFSYLKLSVRPEVKVEFERDLEEMLTLAPQQPGFEGVEVFQLRDDADTYLVLSQWESIDHLRAWEHSPRHDEVLKKHNPRLRQPEEHRRYVPWQRPT